MKQSGLALLSPGITIAKNKTTARQGLRLQVRATGDRAPPLPLLPKPVIQVKFSSEPVVTQVTEETIKAEHEHEVSESLATGTTFGEQAVYYDDVEWAS